MHFLIYFNEKVWISITGKISLKFVTHGPISIKPALVQVMAWHQTGDKAIIWTNDGLVYKSMYMCHLALMSLTQ